MSSDIFAAPLKMKRILGRAQGTDADAMSGAGSAFDGLLLHDASREPAAPTRFVATWNADAYWGEMPRVEFAINAPPNGRRFYLSGISRPARRIAPRPSTRALLRRRSGRFSSRSTNGPRRA